MLATGTELAESDLWGPPPSLSGALIRIDVDPLQAHANHPATVAVIGDAAPALAGLVDALGDATHAPPAAPPGCARSWMPSTAPRRRRGSTGSRSSATR